MNRLFIVFLLFCAPGWAQTTDTLLHKNLEEILVTYSIPLNNDDVLDFYQSNRFASIDDINGRLPGLALVRRGAYAMEPQLGGFSGGQVNVTIDGMHIFGACTDKMDPVTSYVETDNLQGIHLDYGTHGNKFGSAIGGALNMQLWSPAFTSSDSSSISIGYGYESVSGGHNTNLLWFTSKKHFAFRGNVSYRKHQTYKDGNDNIIPFSQYEKMNLFGSAAYCKNQNTCFIGTIIYDKATDVGYPALPMDVATAEGQIYSLACRAKSWHNFRNIEAKLYYNSIYHLMDDSNRDSLFFINNGLDSVYMRMDMPGWSKTTGAYAEGQYYISPKNNLLLKADYYYNNLRADMTMFMKNPANPNEPPMFTETWPGTDRFVSGIYAKYSSYLTANTKFTCSARSDLSSTKMVSKTGKQQFSIFDADIKKSYDKLLINSNISLRQQLGTHWMSELGIGYGERLPSMTEQFGFYLFNAQDGYDYIGNPDIKPEKSQQVNLLLSYHAKKVKARFYSQWSHVKDYIYGRYESEIPQMNLYAQGTKMFVNLPYANLWNNTFDLFAELTRDFAFMSVSQFTYAKNDDGDALPQIAPFKSTNQLQWYKKNTRLTLEGIYSAKQNRIDRYYGETPTDSHFLVNIRVLYKPTFVTGLELNAGVNNVTNAAYKKHLDWGNFNRPGRNFILQVRYGF